MGDGHAELALQGPDEDVEAFHSAVCGAGMGTWRWDIATGHVSWTAQTYRLFGLQPDSFVASYEAFLSRVHAADRTRVAEKIANAVRDLKRSVMEFRILRADGAERWIRCTGRAFADVQGRAAQMTGVIDDITEEKTGAEATPPAQARPARGRPALVRPAPARGLEPFSTKQVAQLLGVGEATVKRLADGNGIGCLRSSVRGNRRFAPEHLVQYLRSLPGGSSEATLDEALRAGDLNAALAAILEAMAGDATIEGLLDEAIVPAAASRPELTADLLKRLPALGSEAGRHAGPAVVARIGAGRALEASLISCVLKAHGFEVLTPSEHTPAQQVVPLAERVSARFVALVLGRSDRAVQDDALSAASAIASRLRGGSVCVQVDGRVAVPGNVAPVGALRELGRLLRGT